MQEALISPSGTKSPVRRFFFIDFYIVFYFHENYKKNLAQRKLFPENFVSSTKAGKRTAANLVDLPPRRAILFLERKSIKKNFNFALQVVEIPTFPPGNDMAFLIKE